MYLLIQVRTPMKLVQQLGENISPEANITETVPKIVTISKMKQLIIV